MRLFLDTASIKEIESAAKWGVLSGVTTNPTLLAKEGWSSPEEAIRGISSVIGGPISIEVLSSAATGMVEEARRYASISPQVVIKLPITTEGLAAATALRKEGIGTNITLVFSAAQALLAAQTGSNYVSVFVGRWDDISTDGIAVVNEAAEIFRLHGIKTEIIAASIRHPLHVLRAAQAGAHIATIPFKVLEQMVNHPLTTTGIEKFLSDWEKARGMMPIHQ